MSINTETLQKQLTAVLQEEKSRNEEKLKRAMSLVGGSNRSKTKSTPKLTPLSQKVAKIKEEFGNIRTGAFTNEQLQKILSVNSRKLWSELLNNPNVSTLQLGEAINRNYFSNRDAWREFFDKRQPTEEECSKLYFSLKSIDGYSRKGLEIVRLMSIVPQDVFSDLVARADKEDSLYSLIHDRSRSMEVKVACLKSGMVQPHDVARFIRENPDLDAEVISLIKAQYGNDIKVINALAGSSHISFSPEEFERYLTAPYMLNSPSFLISRKELPQKVADVLLEKGSEAVAAAVVRNQNIKVDFAKYVADPRRSVVRALAAREDLPQKVADALVKNTDAEVVVSVVKNKNVKVDFDECLHHPGRMVVAALAARSDLSDHIIEELAKNRNFFVSQALARNSSIPTTKLLLSMAMEPESITRRELTADELASLITITNVPEYPSRYRAAVIFNGIGSSAITFEQARKIIENASEYVKVNDTALRPILLQKNDASPEFIRECIDSMASGDSDARKAQIAHMLLNKPLSSADREKVLMHLPAAYFAWSMPENLSISDLQAVLVRQDVTTRYRSEILGRIKRQNPDLYQQYSDLVTAAKVERLKAARAVKMTARTMMQPAIG